MIFQALYKHIFHFSCSTNQGFTSALHPRACVPADSNSTPCPFCPHPAHGKSSLHVCRDLFTLSLMICAQSWIP